MMSRGMVPKGFLRAAFAIQRSTSSKFSTIASFNSVLLRSPRIACRAVVGCQRPADVIKVLLLPNQVIGFFTLSFRYIGSISLFSLYLISYCFIKSE